jgi:selenocysteine lyase/cysteine desulfurase
MDKERLRELFPVVRNLTYLNHAALGPLSIPASDAMERHARDQRDYGALHWREWYAEIDRTRRAAATLIGAEPGEIAILKNTSEGLSFVAEGLQWREGDNVITSDLEFPSNATPWKRLARKGVEMRTVRSRDGMYTVDDVARLIDARTRLVSVSSVLFHNGFAPDLEAIGALCARHDVLFCVDAIQSLGVIPMNVRAANISFLAADGHKWLCGPEGAAIFYVAAERRDELEVLESGWTNFDRKGKFIDCSIELLADSRRFEAGTLNTNGIYGLRAAIELLLELGIEVVQAEVIRLATLLVKRLHAIGVVVATPQPIRSGIVAAIPPAVDWATLNTLAGTTFSETSGAPTRLAALHLWLEQQKIVCAPREGLLRFALHAFNDEADVERVVETLSRVMS